jgi:uncharacterized membrane protein YfcA
MSQLFFLPPIDFFCIFLIISLAYLVFGIAGFGTALVASPVLAMFIPLAKIVPLLALMDMFAALSNILRDGRQADFGELRRLIPLVAIGSLAGAAILLKTRADILLLALGLFVIAYSAYALSGVRPQRRFGAGAAYPFGLVGGVFSALFGSGGFLYAIYLSGRIEQKESLRITQSTLIGLSTMTRVVLFALAGIYMDYSLLVLALTLAPAMLCGVFVGRHITLRLTREQFIRVINVVVLAAGIVLVVRYFRH